MPLHGYTMSEKLFADPLDKDHVLYTGRFLTIDINHDGITDLFGTLQFLDQHGPASYVAFFGDGTGGFKKAPKSTLKNITEGSSSPITEPIGATFRDTQISFCLARRKAAS